MKKVTIYTDGSCLGNPGSGGWAAVLTLDGTNARLEICGGMAPTTNNRMEILGVIEALKRLKEPCDVNVYSDSQYVCNAISKGWLWNWIRKNWVKSNKEPVKNADLWARLADLLAYHHVRFNWLKGHDGHPENELCDELARDCASQKNLPKDEGFTSDCL